jgi:hypothetical protein
VQSIPVRASVGQCSVWPPITVASVCAEWATTRYVGRGADQRLVAARFPPLAVGADPAGYGGDLDRLREAARRGERLEIQHDEGDVEAVGDGQHGFHRRPSAAMMPAIWPIRN